MTQSEGQQLRFAEPNGSADITITLDVTRRPRKTLPRDVADKTPIADELLAIVGDSSKPTA
jgi:hypothetical protein